MKPSETDFGPGGEGGAGWAEDLGLVNRLLAEAKTAEAWTLLSGVEQRLRRRQTGGPDPEALRAYLGEGEERAQIPPLMEEVERALESCATLSRALLLDLERVRAALRFQGPEAAGTDAAWLSEWI
jgi:hypothetical protein